MNSMNCFVFAGLLVIASYLVLVSCGDSKSSLLQDIIRGNASREDIRRKAFEIYLKLHNRTYLEEELPKRLEAFWKRREQIQKSIKDFAEGKSSYSMRENDFMELDEEELSKRHGYKMLSEEERKKMDEELAAENEDDKPQMGAGSLPESVDWRSSGCVYKPYDQGQCGSCFATAAAGVVESMRCLKQGYPPRLSYQQIVDCTKDDPKYHNNGCEGGYPGDSLKYYRDVIYATDAECYPNIDGEQSCKFNSISNNGECLVKASPTNRNNLKYKEIKSEEAMKEAIANVGPIMVGLEARDGFMYYGEGIYRGEDCDNKVSSHNHAVMAVGYGSENGEDFWILRNSYGENWGLNGYMKIKRGANTCGVGYLSWVLTA